jgi:hypothetical protein
MLGFSKFYLLHPCTPMGVCILHSLSLCSWCYSFLSLVLGDGGLFLLLSKILRWKGPDFPIFKAKNWLVYIHDAFEWEPLHLRSNLKDHHFLTLCYVGFHIQVVLSTCCWLFVICVTLISLNIIFSCTMWQCHSMCLVWVWKTRFLADLIFWYCCKKLLEVLVFHA